MRNLEKACTLGDKEFEIVSPVSPGRQAGPVLLGYGTRPEQIKLAPVAHALTAAGFECVELRTGQHPLVPMTPQAPRSIEIQAGVWSDGLARGAGAVMARASWAIRKLAPACVVVQGDTASAWAVAQAAWLEQVPVAHVEAGLRTYASEPWPEEGFRRQIGAIARWHFAPDATAADNLAREQAGSRAGVHVVGNTVIDTLPREPMRVLATLHRRENWGPRRRAALRELVMFAHAYEGVELQIITHPNGSADYAAELGELERAHWLVPPAPHQQFLQMLRDCSLVVTDSGGLQEEAAHFGKEVLVLRTATERTELARLGAIELISPDRPDLLRRALEQRYARRHAYGMGDAAQQIAAVLARELVSAGATR